ncbi:MAG: non-heme iron oxygenase ferredoxin subunit [Candidatus Zixiibacteriota bacterium]
MADFIRIAGTSDIPKGTMKAFEHRHHRLVICHTDEGIYALADECTHDSAPISDGELRGQEVVCTRHGARFDVSDGSVMAPPALVPVDTYEVKVEGDDILVKLD